MTTLLKETPQRSNHPGLVSSIAQCHSKTPLSITEEAMVKLLTHHQVSPEFLTALFACGNSPQAAEAGVAKCCVKRASDGIYGKEWFVNVLSRSCDG